MTQHRETGLGATQGDRPLMRTEEETARSNKLRHGSEQQRETGF